jgi:hypothetical protein
MAGTGLTQKIYRDFSGGLNDTVASLAMKDNELALAENVDFSAEVKAFHTRKGCVNVNPVSFDADVTDGYSWDVGSFYHKCIVVGGIVYQIDVLSGNAVQKIILTQGATEIYPFVVSNILYFGDGSELYSWGGFDYTSEQGTKTILTGDIVRNNDSPSGTKGNFYRAKSDLGSVDLKTATYTDTGKWDDVTDVNGLASNAVRPVRPYNPARQEIVKVTITSGASAAGNVILSLNNVDYATAIAASDSVTSVISKMMATTTTGWTKEKNGNVIMYTKNDTGYSENGYLDPSVTGITASMETVQEGKTNDNDLSPIRKCTMFVYHPGSARVFAAGNPNDNGLFYSEIGIPTYFNSAINKVYPSSGYGRITALGLLSDSVIVSYEDGWYAWRGITPLSGQNPAEWKQLNIPNGCVCHDSLRLAPYSFIFLGKDGIYNISASILEYEIVMLQGRNVIQKITANRIDKIIASIADKRRCRGIFDSNVYCLAFNVLGDSANSRVVKYEFDTKSFTVVTGWNVNKWIRDPENLYFASKNYLMKANTGYSDIDVETGEPKPIAVHVLTKEFDLGSPLTQKFCRLVGLVFKQAVSETESQIDIELNAGYDKYKVNGIIVSESLIYGRDWGLRWGYREAVTDVIEYIQVSNTFQIEFKNERLDDPVTLIAVGFMYRDADVFRPNAMKDGVLLK